ncbi:hypothetical protein DRO66_04825 [Candidatus Bathyarchaeota archaeon]|nr:MAG: hypothetical protein DRO66_04825 [Candidatus Bathyarchaeota archaeon]
MRRSRNRSVNLVGKKSRKTGLNGKMNHLIAYELCPFCGKVLLGDPWDIKNHVKNYHHDQVKDFIPHLKAMIKRWVKT